MRFLESGIPEAATSKMTTVSALYCEVELERGRAGGMVAAPCAELVTKLLIFLGVLCSSSLTRNQVPRNGLGVRIPCPSLRFA